MGKNKIKIGIDKTSYHDSGQINKDSIAKESGKYEDTGGKKTWKIDGKKFEKDSDGVWRDKQTGEVMRGGE